MKFRWQFAVALSLVPFGAALADYADLSKSSATPPPRVEHSSEHLALIEVAELSLSHATQSAQELSIAVQNARRNGDMLLVTCLNDALEDVRAVHTDTIANVGRMSATKTVAEARVVSASVGDANKDLHRAMENAARCKTSEETDGAETMVTIEMNEDSTFDPSANGPTIGLPDINVPPAVNVPPTIDDIDPITDIPMVPPSASPMR